MTLDDAASQRQHASDIADSDVVKSERLGAYGSIAGLQAQMLAAVRAHEYERALVIFGDLTRLAVLAEREACAKIAEDHLRWVHHDSCYEEIAAAIRARP